MKTSIPVLHSSAVMLKIAEMDYSGKYRDSFIWDKFSLPQLLGQTNLISCFTKILAKKSRSEDGKNKKIKIGE